MSKVSEYILNKMEELVDGKECSPVGDYCYQVAEEVAEKFKTQCVVEECGSFDSPGYDLRCYAIAFIDESGNLDILGYEEESY